MRNAACHSERSEESRWLLEVRPFAALRVTGRHSATHSVLSFPGKDSVMHARWLPPSVVLFVALCALPLNALAAAEAGLEADVEYRAAQLEKAKHDFDGAVTEFDGSPAHEQLAEFKTRYVL